MRENTIRGKVLEFLKYLYPEGADDRTVLSVFYPYHNAKQIETAIEYLADKGYVSRRQVPHPYKKQAFVVIYRITPTGIDLVDGVSADAAVAVPPEEGA